jgi:hypothetical protein
MADLGRILALLAGGAGGLGGALDDERERRRVAALDAERQKDQQFGRQLASSTATLAAREKGYVPEVSAATKNAALLAGDTSGLPGGLAFLGGLGRDTRDRMRAKGTVQVPQPDGTLAALSYDPQADEGYQHEVRDATRRSSERTEDRQSHERDVATELQQRLKLLGVEGAQQTDRERAQHGYRMEEIGAQGEAQTRKALSLLTGGSGGAKTLLRAQTAYRNEPAIKDANTIASAQTALRAAAADASGAGDLSLLYAYMKLLDPNSVVRESEFAQAAKAGSLPAQIQGFASRVVNGERLTPEVRAQFLKAAEGRIAGQRELVRATQQRWGAAAPALGVDSARVAYDPYDRPSAPTPAVGGDTPRTQPVGPMQSPADLWEALRARGLSREQATAEVHRLLGGS